MLKKRGQIGTEYLVIMGFISFAVIGILAIGFYYMNLTESQMTSTQITRLADNIISTAEKVYYEGEPSKTTIEVYFPEGITNFSIIENNLVISYQTNNGESKTAFKSNVPINGTISTFSGVRRLLISAKENYVEISSN